MHLGLTVSLAAALLTTAASASTVAMTPASPTPPPERVRAFFDALSRDGLASVERMLAHEPSLARAHDGQGSSALVAAAFILVDGEGFHAPAENRILRAVVAAAPPTNLFEACLVADVERARAFLRASPRAATEVGPFGWQAIHAAAFSGSRTILQLLLRAGANVNAVAKNQFKNIPLQTALLGRQVAAAELLVEAGADVRWRQFEGDTALHDAAAMGFAELVSFLVAHGADVNARDKDGETPLSMATRNGHPEVVRILEAAGAKR